jgi:Zn-dependent protease
MEIVIILIIAISAIAVSVILHEVAHGYVAKYLGDTTAEEEGRLTLNPLVHIHPIYTLALPMFLALIGQPIFGAAKPVPVQGHRLKGEEFGMALVGVAGPLVNLILAIIGGIIFSFSGISGDIWELWWKYFIQVNIGFFLFNLLPIPPLDGSRVLYAFAPEPLQNIMNQLEGIGIVLIFALIFFGGTFFATLLGGPYDAIYTTLTTLGS